MKHKDEGENFKVNKHSSDYYCGYIEGYRKGEREGSEKAYEHGIQVGKKLAHLEQIRHQKEINNG